MACRQPSNISVPGMHGSFLKCPSKNQSSGGRRRPRPAGSRAPRPAARDRTSVTVSNISIRPAPMRGVRTCARRAARTPRRSSRRASLGEGAHLGRRPKRGAATGTAGGSSGPSSRRHLRGVPEHAVGAGELVVGEEPRLPFADGHPQLAAGVAVVVEEEDPDVAVLGVAGRSGSRSGASRPASARAAVEGDLAAEQPVDAVALVGQVDPEPADEQQVRLARLDHRCRPPCGLPVQVPAVRRDVGLGPDRAGAHRARDRIDAGDPVDQQHGGRRQAGLLRPVVQHGELRAEQLGDPALGQPFELGAVERRAARDHTAL